MEAIYFVPQNKNKQELLKRGTPIFPCSTYNRDVRQYINGEISPHWHHEMEIFLLIEGHAHISFVDSTFELESGEGYFVNSNVLHGISCPLDRCCRYHSIVFDPSIISGATGSAYDILYTRPFIEQGGPSWIFHPNDTLGGETIIRLFQAAFDACETKTDGYEFIVRDSLSRILLLLRKHLQGTSSKQSSQQELRIKQMLSWLDEHYMEPITISQLADVAGICVRECQRSFSNILHTTPIQYLNRRRIAMAAECLISTDLSVSEIGLRCGFDNPSYFSKQFKHMTGMTPRAYRQKNHSDNANFHSSLD